MRQSYNACVLSYSDVDAFFNITGRATADAPDFPSTRAIFRACRLERMPASAAVVLRDHMETAGIYTLLFPLAADDGIHVMDVVLLGTLDRYEAGLAALFATAETELVEIAAEIQEALTLYENPLGKTVCGTTEFVWGARTYLMGIVNVTPDSFSGDGMVDPGVALAHALKLLDDGVDIIDLGGESTRPAAVYPGARPIDAKTELKRVMPVMRLLAKEIKVPISIDTYKASVASAALEAGASIVNDVWSLMADREMARIVAEARVPVILMHNQQQAKYHSVVPDVIRGLRRCMEVALDAGIKRENIIVDPGIGFGKTKEHNLEVLNRLDELKVLGRPILLGTSRKFLIGQTTQTPPEQRIEGTAATVALGISKGADIVRVHDVREMARAVRVTDAIVRGKWQGSS